MKYQAAGVTPVAKMQQRLHRQELALARLKKQAGNSLRTQTRLQLRLGGLLTLTNGKSLSNNQLDALSKHILTQLESTENLEKYRTLGTDLLENQEFKTVYFGNQTIVDNDARRSFVEELIIKGERLTAHGLPDFELAVVLGAALSLTTECE